MNGIGYKVDSPDVTSSTAAILADTGTSLPADIAAVQTEVDKIETPSNAVRRLAGKTQIATRNIDEAANAGATTCFTATGGAVLVDFSGVVLRSNGTTTADLTSAAVTVGITEIMDATAAAKANIDADGEHVVPDGGITPCLELQAGETISVDLQGTGATAVNLQITVRYCAITDGAYLAVAA
jgi:hypothetical protein